MQIRVALVAAALLASPQAIAGPLGEVICDDRDRLTEQLQRRHDVARQARALRGPDAILEVWVDRRSGDWTMLQSYTNGTACIIAMGEAWEDLRPANPT